MTIPETTTNMKNPYATEKRVRRLDEVLPDFTKGTVSTPIYPPINKQELKFDDFRERILPPVRCELTSVTNPWPHEERLRDLKYKTPEPILQVCLPMTYSEYTAVTGFLAEYRERFKAQPDNGD